MAIKKPRGKAGNVASYITRNQALIRLQIKLPEFRRLCILKGIHPREPKKKVHGHNKTYYHVKDINFLAHEPLLEKGRELKVHDRKVKKARAKLDVALAERLHSNRPSYTLDHLVKERYPSFIDALRDLDDALTMLHLFATLPADATLHIPAVRVHNARRLSLEWQAYVTKTNALRKTFVSVKGTYYQAQVVGQLITWLVPHPLSQVLPSDVDFRVMLTFLEFYETLVGFTNFKLYHELGLAYPPVLDPRLEEAAAELFGVMREVAKSASKATPALEEEKRTDLGAPVQGVEQSGKGAAVEQNATKQEQQLAESALRLASLQSRLDEMDATQRGASEGEEVPPTAGSEAAEAADVDNEDDDPETQQCRGLFSGLIFHLSREVPRESLLFVIRAFGGSASWDGEGAPYLESDEFITHQVIDRPTQRHRFMQREYVQPQWVYDCANARLLLPTSEYGPGMVPPPHLSPFVDNDVEGYVPEYAEKIKELKGAQAPEGVLPIDGPEEGVRANDGAESIDEGEDRLPQTAQAPADLEDEAAMAQIVMPRKTRKLYEAMQMGKAKQKAQVELLKERKRKAAENEAAVAITRSKARKASFP